VRLDWAATQNNLGNALRTLGQRESGTARLEEAIAAYRAALEERTRQRVPLDWAMTQNNLGIALKALGERENGTAHLTEAVSAFDACLTVAETAWQPRGVQQVRSDRDEARAEIAPRRRGPGDGGSARHPDQQCWNRHRWSASDQRRGV
jgi:tetratricopeptide (TPR) repeat protein